MPIFKRRDLRRDDVVEAHQWFKNGDHPLDDVWRAFEDTGKFPTTPREGEVVRCFRRHDIPGDRICPWCDHKMDVHGWIDQGLFSSPVCPGDYVVNGEGGRYYVRSWEFFDLYERVEVSKPYPPPDKERWPFELLEDLQEAMGSPAYTLKPEDSYYSCLVKKAIQELKLGQDARHALAKLSMSCGNPALARTAGESLDDALVRYVVDTYISKGATQSSACGRPAFPDDLGLHVEPSNYTVCQGYKVPLLDEEKIGDKPQVVEREERTPDGKCFHVTEVDVSTPRNENQRCAMILGVRAAKKIFRVRDAFQLALVEERNNPRKTDEDTIGYIESLLTMVTEITDRAQEWFSARNEEQRHDHHGHVKFGDFIGLHKLLQEVVDNGLANIAPRVDGPNSQYFATRAQKIVYEMMSSFMSDLDHEQAAFERRGFKETISARAYGDVPQELSNETDEAS